MLTIKGRRKPWASAWRAADSSVSEGAVPYSASRPNRTTSSARLKTRKAKARRTQRRVGLVTYGVPDSRLGLSYIPITHSQVHSIASSIAAPSVRVHAPHAPSSNQPPATTARPTPHPRASRGTHVSNLDNVRRRRKRPNTREPTLKTRQVAKPASSR